MKKRNLLLQAVTVVAFSISILATTPTTAKAATAPKSTTIVPKVEYLWSSSSSGGSYTGAIHVDLDDKEDYIGNIKSKNSSLIAKQTYAYAHFSTRSNTQEQPYAMIGLYAKKNLNTVVTFDVFDANGKKKESKSVKVVAKSNPTTTKPPFKSITFNGKPLVYGKLYTKSSGTLKVKMNSNFKLVSIKVGTYTTPKKQSTSSDSCVIMKNEMTYKTVKNNQKIKLGTNCDTYSYVYGTQDSNYYSSSYETRILAPTQILITYKNKKTKATGTLSYTIYRIAK